MVVSSGMAVTMSAHASSGGGVDEEEGHTDRYVQPVPHGRRLDSGKGLVTIGHGAEALPSGTVGVEDQIAGTARAHQRPVVQVDDVPVVVIERGRTHLAALARP
jgi:hypothetical protein